MSIRLKLLLAIIPAMFLLAFSAPARAGAGGMGLTGEDACGLINQAFGLDTLMGDFGPIDAALIADPSLPNPPCDIGSWPIALDAGVDAAGFQFLSIPTPVCDAFNALEAASCSLVALVPEPGRLPLVMLVVGAGGIIGYRRYKRRA